MEYARLIGELLLRADNAEEENAALKEGRRKPKQVGKKRRGRMGTPKSILELLKEAPARMTQRDFENALPDTKPMTIYMALRDLRMTNPPLVDVTGSGMNNDAYQYGLPGKHE